MLKFEKRMKLVIEGCGIVGVAILLAMMLMTVADVIMRFFFRRPIIGSIDNMVTLAIALIITWRSFMEAMSVKEMGATSPILGIPRYPFVFVVSFGFFLLLSAAVILFMKNMRSLKDPGRTD